MKFRTIRTVALAAALCATQAFAADMKPASGDFAKAETAKRLIDYGQQLKDPNMLRAAAALMAEVGPIAKEVKDGKAEKYDVEALLKEADGYGEARALDLGAAKANQCYWWYNCDTSNNCRYEYIC